MSEQGDPPRRVCKFCQQVREPVERPDGWEFVCHRCGDVQVERVEVGPPAVVRNQEEESNG